jgi:hypothetical protein
MYVCMYACTQICMDTNLHVESWAYLSILFSILPWCVCTQCIHMHIYMDTYLAVESWADLSILFSILPWCLVAQAHAPHSREDGATQLQQNHGYLGAKFYYCSERKLNFYPLPTALRMQAIRLEQMCNTHTHGHARTDTHTHTHTRTHAHARTHARTHTHTHTQNIVICIHCMQETYSCVPR